MEDEAKAEDRNTCPDRKSQEKGGHSGHGIGLGITPDGPFDRNKIESDEAENKRAGRNQERQ
jgi:hypothetical protein